MAFEFFAEVTESSDADYKIIEQALKELRETDVLVGIPEEEASREGEGIPNNAELMYIHSNGSPLQNIPARPVIEPALSDAKEELGKIMAGAAQSAMDGDTNAMREQLNIAGLAGQRAAQAWFLNPKNGWPPNADSTIAYKRRKTERVARPKKKQPEDSDNEAFKEASKSKKESKYESVVSDPKPLIDTGELRRSITYIVRRKT